MDISNFKVNGKDVNTLETVIELAISNETEIPLGLTLKLLKESSHIEMTEQYHVVNIMTNNWNLGNHLYRDLMDYLASINEDLYCYAHVNKETDDRAVYGGATHYLSLLTDLIQAPNMKGEK